MRIREVAEKTIPLSRYADPSIPSGSLTTSLVRVVIEREPGGRPIIGHGFASIGRFAQGGLMRERFIPRLLAASPAELATDAGDNLDPERCWRVMMRDEKPGGHGERCVALGALDMAIWDAAAKIAAQPLWRFLAARTGRTVATAPAVELYASGGYPYPADDLSRMGDEIRCFLDQGYRRVKIKIASAGDDGPGMDRDLRRIEVALKLLPSPHSLAVDAMNRYSPAAAAQMAQRLSELELLWLEDLCDPHDFETQREIAARNPVPLAVGEALFSLPEAKLLLRHGGLRADRDILLFDPAHCYGLTHFLRIVDAAGEMGWSRRSFWPHGGHLFSLHVAAGLGLGGSEINPLAFPPLGGLAEDQRLTRGCAVPPDLPGIGLEGRGALAGVLASF